jgi:hypothetical protein
MALAAARLTGDDKTCCGLRRDRKMFSAGLCAGDEFQEGGSATDRCSVDGRGCGLLLPLRLLHVRWL